MYRKRQAYLDLGHANVVPDSVVKSADCPDNGRRVAATSVEADGAGDDTGGSEPQPRGGVYRE